MGKFGLEGFSRGGEWDAPCQEMGYDFVALLDT